MIEQGPESSGPNLKGIFKMQKMNLATVNALRANMGLAPLSEMPGVMRPGKTANANRKQAAANAAMRAEQNRATKAKRTSKGK